MNNLYYSPPQEEEWNPTKRNLLFAWSTHVFTASGAIWGFLAILAITNQQWVAAFVWMTVSVFVDAFDGLLARRARVKEVIPRFDGALLDNMVDYLNYVIVPAIFIYSYGFTPTSVSLLAVFLIMLASAYQFCQSDAKTEDHYYKGFPSYWNILAFYLFVLNLSTWANFLVIIVLVVLVFIPIKYVYPSRTVRYQQLTMVLSIVWGITCCIILFQYPEPNANLIWLSLLFAVYYVGISLFSMLTTKQFSSADIS
ncbi:MAG: CDP-alcohol phosphatidyltransferase family protein [Chloroflexota bacterium]